MRTGASFDHGAGAGASTAGAPTTSAPGAPHSLSWQSPVPYLFGGLAAMLALIALALLILACSYWKLSSYLDSGDSADEPSDNHEKQPASKSAAAAAAAQEERFLVIMAGDRAPTFIAVPIDSRGTFLAVDSSDGAVSSLGSDGNLHGQGQGQDRECNYS